MRYINVHVDGKDNGHIELSDEKFKVPTRRYIHRLPMFDKGEAAKRYNFFKDEDYYIVYDEKLGILGALPFFVLKTQNKKEMKSFLKTIAGKHLSILDGNDEYIKELYDEINTTKLSSFDRFTHLTPDALANISFPNNIRNLYYVSNTYHFDDDPLWVAIDAELYNYLTSKKYDVVFCEKDVLIDEFFEGVEMRTYVLAGKKIVGRVFVSGLGSLFDKQYKELVGGDE